ncbi:AAA-like domain protein [mine drainage metagenome]|uniref:AAA-like domain protein n=1 Tax=mine drainage metagenome TaxID=410659 RepID=A0A1J5Q680_9ZZZZ
MATQSRNPGDPIDNLAIGKIIEVDGLRIIAELHPQLSELSRVFAGDTYPIGQFGSIIRVHFGRRIVYASVGRLRMKAEYEAEHGLVPNASPDERIIEADLFGEGEWTLKGTVELPEWKLEFERGVATYPLPQQNVYLTPKSELRSIYGNTKEASIQLGVHVGSGGAPCIADMNALLGKHTAILGSTGAGKSGTVAAIIHSVLERGSKFNYETWRPRIVILDPHNEYGSAFPSHSRLSTDDGTLSLPYWLLSFQETVLLLIGKTEFLATSQSNIIKSALLAARSSICASIGLVADQITIDSPVPYSLDDFLQAVEEQRPPGKDKKEQEPFNSVVNKLEVLRRDSRMNFMMTPWDEASDPIADLISRIMGDVDPIKIVDMSGVPNEIAGIASAVIARTLFNLKVWQTPEERARDPILLVCEEAHRYVPNRGEALYEAAQEAIRRVAKEGRKYGVGLMLISQRPSEVDATVLSQCNSWIVLRITNDADRNHVKAILPDSMAGLTKMLSGLRRQEAIFVGEATMLPSRILIRDLSQEQLPKSNDIDFDKGWQNPTMTPMELTDIVTRWRYQKR